jgi:hypothetical protein
VIKFLGYSEGRPMLAFGLSRANCEKLLEGKPIFIDLKVMMIDVENVPNLNDATVLIFGGETESAMVDKLKSTGLKMPETAREHHEEN